MLLIIVQFPAYSADIYGKVWFASNSKPAFDLKISITCEGLKDTPKKEDTIDKYGRYRLTKLPAKKKCMISVAGSIEQKVYSGANSKRVNIEIRKGSPKNKIVIR